MNLLTARTQVRFLTDDSDVNPLVSDAEIDAALRSAQAEVWALVISAGVNIYQQTATVSSDAQGRVDLASLKPVKVGTVSLLQGNYRTTVSPCRQMDWSMPVQQVQQLSISYVPRVAFPANDAAEFVWSLTSTLAPTLDKLVCAIAASEVWVRTGERPNAVIEQRKSELSIAAVSQTNIPSFTVVSTSAGSRYPRNSKAPYQWVAVQQDLIQLVYPG